ncbi:MAG: hypothetical protein SFU98_00585 [Leptospiraceae bacterium]|nr:hypothetical protein [Leptospiraceae bacterium]
MINKLIIFLLLVLIVHCGSENSIREIPNEEKLNLSVSLKNVPKEFSTNSGTLEIRFYNCEGVNFGKKNPDSGTYKYSKNDCRKNYYTKSEMFSGNKFNITSNAPKEWSHLAIHLKGTESIEGKFSVGENPAWFLSKDVLSSNNSKTITHEFNFVSMENPIPKPKRESIAKKFAPVIVLKKDKKFIPSNLSKYAGKYKKEVYKGKNKDSEQYELIDPRKDEYLVLDESKYGEGETHLYYHVRYAKTLVSGTSEKSLPGFRDNSNYQYFKDKGEIVVSFFLWYDYNEGPSGMGNRHEGDFESFAILLNAKEEPIRVFATGHNHVMIDTEWKNINSINNHPIIYIAHGRGNADGGNPTSFYGGYEVSLEAGNFLFNLLANPKDIFPSLENDAQILSPSDITEKELKSVRIGPGEWIDGAKTKYIDATKIPRKPIDKLVNWEEPGLLGDLKENSELKEIFSFRGRLGKHPRSKLNFLEFAQYGKSPVNPPFKMNEEQHYTMEKPSFDRCEKARIGDYCPKFIGDSKTPQIVK